jgi:hypothetical protein
VTRSDDKQFLWWKTEDQSAEKVPYEEVKADVEKAWYRLKARELAKKAADVLVEEAKKTKGDRKQLEDLAARQKQKVIDLGGLARQKREKVSHAEADYAYGRAKIDKDKIPNPGPGEGVQMAQDLLKLRDKPVGDTVVVADGPEGTYYVAVLLKESDPSMSEFLEAYQNSATGSKKRDPLFNEYLLEQQLKYRREVVKRLQEDAQLVIVDPEKLKALGQNVLED